jgi:hypothetical protein
MGNPRVVPRQAKCAWYNDLTGYQCLVVWMAAISWTFDTMAQQLFNLNSEVPPHATQKD